MLRTESWISIREILRKHNRHSMLRGGTAPGMSYTRNSWNALQPLLSYEEHGALESVIMNAFDHMKAENAMDTASMMCVINGMPQTIKQLYFEFLQL